MTPVPKSQGLLVNLVDTAQVPRSTPSNQESDVDRDVWEGSADRSRRRRQPTAVGNIHILNLD